MVECLDAVVDGAECWLVLAHLPSPLDRREWGGSSVMAALRRLHAVPTGLVIAQPARFRPGWAPVMTDAAVEVMSLDAHLVGLLTGLQQQSEVLFDESHVIFGDPNPLNWRTDARGGPVLIDAERMTVGSPAVDIAIALPGLPDRVRVDQARAHYGEGAPPTAEILLAKTWTVIELAAASAPESRARALVQDIAPAFTRWVREWHPA